MTFSIVARDPATGAFGVATATAGPMVGALVPHIRRGVGAAATQAMTNPYLAIDALGAMDGVAPAQALREALADDKDADLRQVILVGIDGVAAGWTGARCIGFAGHIAETGVAVAGNLLSGEAVLPAMLARYRERLGGAPFAVALLEALRAGALAGGDKRGLGSAALRVQSSQGFADIDLRVDLSTQPLADLDELMGLALAGPYQEFFSSVPRR